MYAATEHLASVDDACKNIRPYSRAKERSLEKHVHQLIRDGDLVDTRKGEKLPTNVPRITRDSLNSYVEGRRQARQRTKGKAASNSRGGPTDGRDSIQVLLARIDLLVEQNKTDRQRMTEQLEREIEAHRRTAEERDAAKRDSEFGAKILDARLSAERLRADDAEGVIQDQRGAFAQAGGPQSTQDLSGPRGGAGVPRI
jgi:hypothetical protein